MGKYTLINNVEKSNFFYKFHTPIKYCINVCKGKENTRQLEISIKVNILIRCLRCSIFFLKKIQSKSKIKIFLKEKNFTYLNKKRFFNLKKIIKEEIFYSLPLLNKHNKKNCIEYFKKNKNKK